MLRAAGYLAMSGQIVDATIVAAPKQRNTEAERAAIKAGQVPGAPGGGKGRRVAPRLRLTMLIRDGSARPADLSSGAPAAALQCVRSSL
jgi:hypothetical protein